MIDFNKPIKLPTHTMGIMMPIVSLLQCYVHLTVAQ